MFYNEQGKHMRTKKEILDESGSVRKGCKIIMKGKVYESRLFTNKNPYFKSDEFLAEEKKLYTELINRNIENPLDRLQVFDRNSVYLPTKKIGKNNPKEVEILNDNKARQEWNYSVDKALIAGVEDNKIYMVKKEKISLKVKNSIAEDGRKPGLFQSIVDQATIYLKSITERWKVPPKPILKIDMIEFRKMQDIKVKLEKQIGAVRQVEQQEIPELKKELLNMKGIFKGKQRKVAEANIIYVEERLSSMKAYLNTIIGNSGYKTVQGFMQMHKRAEIEVLNYQKALEQYVARGGQKPPEENSIREKLRRLSEDVRHKKNSKSIQRKREKGER